MDHSFYASPQKILNDGLAFIYNDLLHEFGIAAAILGALAMCSLDKIEIYAMDGVLWLAKRVTFGTHFCDILC